MCGARFWNIHELPAEPDITSYTTCGSQPARIPSAIASAIAAMCTPARSWLTILIREPWPGLSPRR